jgi:ATP-dependent protease ClpP protease subunit
MAVIVEDGRLTLTGYVGEPSFEYEGVVLFDGFTHPEVLAALAEIGDETDLTVHINSGGGYANEGGAIRSALARRKGRTDVVIDGIAASAASLIAMAGETISMSLGSQMMIHDPSGITIGTAADHEAQVRALNSLGGTYASVYADRSGKTKDECRDIMRAETWFEPEEAVAAGFADAVLGNRSQPVAAFPYQTYAHAPRRLVAAASEQGWRLPSPHVAALQGPKPAAPAAPTSQEEQPMADQNPAGHTPAELDAARREAVAQDRARRAAIMALDESKGREALAEVLHASEMTVEQVQVALKAAPAPVAPAASPEPAPVAANESSRLAGVGLGGLPKPKAERRVDLVADMKRRSGIQA